MDEAELRYVAEQRNPWLHAWLDAVAAPAGLATHIHRRDEMFTYALAVREMRLGAALVLYHRSGLEAWQLLRQIRSALAEDDRGPLPWLDVAAGYGRVTRWALAEPEPAGVDPAHLTVMEIDRQALAHQRDSFGVEVLESDADPERALAGERRWPLVSALSLLTHLPETRCRRWLARLWAATAEGGALVVSTCDTDRMPAGMPPSEDGFAFEAHSESDDLSDAEYGTAWISARRFRREVEALDAVGAVRHLPRGLWSHQDLWVLQRRDDPTAWALELHLPPQGYLDGSEILGPRRYRLTGWAIDPDRRAAPEVDILQDGELAATTVAEIPRADLEAQHGPELVGGGWDVTIEPAGLLSGEEMIAVRLRTPSTATVVHTSRLDGADGEIRRQIATLEHEAELRVLRQRLRAAPSRRTWAQRIRRRLRG